MPEIHVPLGTTDDAAALQAAINQAGAGGRVVMAQGRVLLNATVHINTSLVLAGSGPGTTLQRAPGFAGDLLEIRQAPNVVVKDFAIDLQLLTLE